MILLFYIFALLLIYLSYRSFRGGLDYLNYFKKELAKPGSGFAPFAAIIAPCKGLDEGLKENLSSLVEQDYPDYEVIFVVDDKNDPAVPVIEEVSRKDAKHARVVVAPKAVTSSQKVENLREAVLHAKGDVLVFADSDARPSKDWLRHLVAPLNNKQVGAATGYRWFISKEPTFASEMRSAWNASVASALGPNGKNNFCWGGSTAIRRETFERLNIRERWSGVLSDDFTVTRAMNEAGLDIFFVPQALVVSVEGCTFRELIEFTTRQMKITRVYAPHYWKLSLFGSGLFTTVMLAAFAIVVLSKQTDLSVAVAITTIILVSLFSTGKSWLRLKSVKLVLSQYADNLKQQTLPQLTFWLLAPPLFLFNSLAALVSRRLTWRGTRYELVSPTETRVLPETKT